MRPLPLLWLLLAGACVDHRYFAPRENANGTGPGGHPAAVYPVQSGSAAGEVRLWSRGSHAVGRDGEQVVEVHVGFELENTGACPLRLDPGSLQCDELWVRDERLTQVQPRRCEGEVEALPGTTSRLHAWFRAGATTSARDVAAFAVRFVVTGADGAQLLAQVTPFEPYVPDDPWGRDPWFWGPGFGWYGGYGYCGYHWR